MVHNGWRVTHTDTYKEILVYTMIQRADTRGRFHVYNTHAKECTRAHSWPFARLRVRLEEICREVEKKREGQAMHTQVGG